VRRPPGDRRASDRVRAGGHVSARRAAPPGEASRTSQRRTSAERATVPRTARRLVPDEAVSVWLRLLKVKALLERDVRRQLDGFTLPQFDVLNQLTRRPEGMTFVELSREMLVTAGNLTGIVDRLERDGLVHRGLHPEDRRAFRLTLTSRGQKAVTRAVGVHNAAVARRMALLPRQDLRRLREILGRLRDALEQGPTERPIRR
jgi:DNA-binding MarR family transcriptional regulator